SYAGDSNCTCGKARAGCVCGDNCSCGSSGKCGDGSCGCGK
ncbi:unnamed protein product, partial [Ectocarpus sp. 12 AP-2014]